MWHIAQVVVGRHESTRPCGSKRVFGFFHDEGRQLGLS